MCDIGKIEEIPEPVRKGSEVHSIESPSHFKGLAKEKQNLNYNSLRQSAQFGKASRASCESLRIEDEESIKEFIKV